MDGKAISEYCLSKKGVVEDLPFGPDVLVYKVASKIFILISDRGSKLSISVKCDPILAEDFRQRYSSVTPGYHMNKRHWNTIVIDESIPENELFWMINHSYELILKSLTKAERDSM